MRSGNNIHERDRGREGGREKKREREMKTDRNILRTNIEILLKHHATGKKNLEILFTDTGNKH